MKLLITGGTGFLGRNLAVKLKNKFDITLTGRNGKQNLLAKQVTGCEVHPMDVSKIESVRDTISEIKPNIVIHAAATKFVDWSEKFPMECIDSNVIGSQNVARVCIDKNVETVIGISTDKASPPIRNTYGLTKSLMEKMFCTLNRKYDTKFACVRYGNVAWSTGSVLPIWKKMIEEKGVIETTGPGMRRFFFTVDEAVQLVVTSIKIINDIQGCILSQKMKSAQMLNIIKIWTRMTKSTWKQIEGRPGERVDEFLIGEIEHPYTIKINIDGKTHYMIIPNVKCNNPITEEISTKTAERLHDVEIMYLLNKEPMI